MDRNPDQKVEIDFNPNGDTFDTMPTVTVSRGIEHIRFVRNAKHAGWNFFGIAIWPEGGSEPSEPGDVCAPFNDPEPKVQDHGVLVVDNNPGGQDATFNYKIWVTKPGSSQTYTSDPEIINKGG